MMLVPEPWEKASTMDPDRQAFYAYYAPMMEAWDGPAAIVFTDGVRSVRRLTETVASGALYAHG